MEEDTQDQPTAASLPAVPVPPVPACDPIDPPGDGEEALHYAGTEPLTLDGHTFAPDSLTIVPAATAMRLAGTRDLRVVQESAESWPHYLAMRARARGTAAG